MTSNNYRKRNFVEGVARLNNLLTPTLPRSAYIHIHIHVHAYIYIYVCVAASAAAADRGRILSMEHQICKSPGQRKIRVGGRKKNGDSYE